MEPTDWNETAINSGANANDLAAPVTSPATDVTSTLTPQSCPACGAAKPANNGPGAVPSYIYALGKIGPRFPSPSIEKEYAQVVGRGDATGLTDPQVLHKTLSERHNRYLV